MSSKNFNSGIEGEAKAADFLRKNGYSILTTNYRYKTAEVDIIAKDHNIHPELLVFVEVKYRKSKTFGYPEEFVTKQKIRLMKMLAEYYTYRTDWQKDIRFDIISILHNDIKHIKDII